MSLRVGTARRGGAGRRWAGTFAYGVLLAATALVLSSCATWKPQRLKNGQAGYRVDCSGPSLTWSHCYQKAGRACPHGYTIMEKSGKSHGHVVTGDLFDIVGDHVQHRRLIIRCTEPDSSTPGAVSPQD